VLTTQAEENERLQGIIRQLVAEREAAPCEDTASDWRASSRASSLPTPRLSPTDVWDHDMAWTTPLPTLVPFDPATSELALPPAMVPLFPGLPVIPTPEEGARGYDFMLSHCDCRL